MENEIDDQASQDLGGESDTEKTDNGEGTAGDGATQADDLEKLREQNKQLYARAKKAEGFELKDGKWVKKTKPLEIKTESNKPNTLTRDEAILYAKGYTEEEVDLANKLAFLNGTTPLKAIDDEVFKSKVASRKKKELSDNASLPSSSGSGFIKSEKPVGKMTKEEHEAYYRKVMGV